MAQSTTYQSTAHQSTAPLNDSEFHMWRALFALAFVDNAVSTQEKSILKAYQSGTMFSPEQLAVLRDDFMHPKNVEALHSKITDPRHKARFCALARVLLWCDGDPDRQEEEILRRVACLKEPAEYDILRASRNSPHLHAYYGRYHDAGMLGLMDNIPHNFEVRV